MQMNKGAEHSAVVYTPGELDEEGLHLFNITLPEGMFTSDVLPDPGTHCCGVLTYSSASRVQHT